jgi:hypothetical protein
MTPPAVGDTLWPMLPSLDPSTLQAFLADPARPAGTLQYRLGLAKPRYSGINANVHTEPPVGTLPAA